VAILSFDEYPGICAALVRQSSRPSLSEDCWAEFFLSGELLFNGGTVLGSRMGLVVSGKVGS